MEKTKTKVTKAPSAPKKTKSVSSAPKKGTPISHGVGRRKSSIARVWLRAGKGRMVINGKEYNHYFDTDIARMEASTPFRVLPVGAQFDVEVNVLGGGLSSQAGAVKLGLARAIVKADEGTRSVLRQHKLLTVDARRKERKKYGQRGARRRFQFVKR